MGYGAVDYELWSCRVMGQWEAKKAVGQWDYGGHGCGPVELLWALWSYGLWSGAIRAMEYGGYGAMGGYGRSYGKLWSDVARVTILYPSTYLVIPF
jgi:hypothetical protein